MWDLHKECMINTTLAILRQTKSKRAMFSTKNMKNIIPEQKEGKKLDCFETVDFESTAAASHAFDTVCAHLARVNQWYELAEIPATTFQLTDRSGQPIDRPIQLHDYIRLDIPGPGLPSSDGYDWVTVVNIVDEGTEELKLYALTLKPCPDPRHPDNRDTAHFFEGVSSSTFLIEQRRNSILIQYAGRNEIVNVENSHLTDNIRNFIIGLGAKVGASYPQWKSLVKGLANSVSQR
ncbi:Uncharacterised protein [Sphingobacterium thalpophilum]|uniref:Uncharacterized protein n=3 Tax=Sphingobacteriaceae TaxID=84566 RepID=A0A4U9W0Z6_9SPHI|nr:Uncharacterised protein [Sphingobacterium thalpophilum]